MEDLRKAGLIKNAPKRVKFHLAWEESSVLACWKKEKKNLFTLLKSYNYHAGSKNFFTQADT